MIPAAIVSQARKYNRKVIIGISGPQGSGKTTATKAAAAELNSLGIPTYAVSIDDFYKPYLELKELANSSKNKYLQQRGLPGTHDTSDLLQFLTDFLNGSRHLTIPEYDKSAHSGAGDRIGIIELPANVQIILLEGWMVGFMPVQNVPDPDLSMINQNLSKYVDIWNKCSEFIVLKPQDLKLIYQWRTQQEHDLIAKTGRGMTDLEVKKFVDQYMPCYKIYDPPSGLEFILDKGHKAI